MSREKSRLWVIDAALFTGLVYVATVMFQVYQPATGGYFNLGESAIYLAALLTSPLVAGVAGGVGSALADATTGYGIFAPGTLVIKFVEGFVAGVLVRKASRLRGPLYAISASLTYALLIFIIGSRYLVGTVHLGTAWRTLSFSLPMWFWMLVSVMVFAGILVIGFRKTYPAETFSLLTSGLLMVTGYFLYEYLVTNPLIHRPRIAAAFEIPVNIGQALIGSIIAVSVYAFLIKAGFVRSGSIGSRGGQ